ncbi:MAG TPA: cation diffusion facilitator family transporter, partial [Bacteroidales bacterium]|nr:cation diffusion facilitator family transporter [Bacteroidales bacterium]
VEGMAGIISNSTSLIADAGHNLSDVLTLILSWIAISLSQKQPTPKFTYGFRRSTILAALLNTILLLITVGFIIYETIARLSHPVTINANSMVIVASIGIAVNGFTAWLFMKDKNHDLNIRSAFVHFLSDALISLGVVIAGVLVKFTGMQWFDSAVSFLIIAVILYGSYKLLIDSVNLALDAVPENINIELVLDYLKRLPAVTGVHDLHIWSLGTTNAALTVHLKTCVPTDVSFITSIQHQLYEQFNIDHSTIQVEYGSDEDCGNKF